MPARTIARTPTTYNLTLTNADTEYSQALPANTRQFSIQCRTGYDVRMAFVTGKVATSAAPYATIKANGAYSSPESVDVANSLQSASLTLYFASSQAGVVMEIICWT